MRGVIVADNVNLLILGRRLIDLAQKRQPFLMAMPLGAGAQHLPCQGVLLVASRTVRFYSTSIVRFCLPPISPEAVGRWADRGRCLGSGVNPGPLF